MAATHPNLNVLFDLLLSVEVTGLAFLSLEISQLDFIIFGA